MYVAVCVSNVPLQQCDQIGRIFDQWVNFLRWAVFLKITEVSQIFGLLFTTVPVVYYSGQKIGWATFWATFSQTHLVSLLCRNISVTDIAVADSADIFKAQPFRKSLEQGCQIFIDNIYQKEENI
jgi:hypothetical protein